MYYFKKIRQRAHYYVGKMKRDTRFSIFIFKLSVDSSIPEDKEELF